MRDFESVYWVLGDLGWWKSWREVKAVGGGERKVEKECVLKARAGTHPW